MLEQHLATNKCQQNAQTVFQVPENEHHIAYQKEQAPQSHDGKNIRKENDVWILGHCEYGRNAVHGKNKVAEFHHQQDNEQRCQISLTVLHCQEPSFNITGPDCKIPGSDPYNKVFFRIDALIFVFGNDQPYS